MLWLLSVSVSLHISLLMALTASFTAKLIRDGALFSVEKTIVAAGGSS